jgi:Fic-DOC domain mobile mystery protein B
MGLNLTNNYGQSPLEEDEREGLLIESITTRGELDEFEQLNIEKALEWTIHNKPGKEKILTEDFIKHLHRKMFGDVWSWAGNFRRSNKNIGVDWTNIGVELKKLLDDTKYWIENKVYEPDEIAIRFKHRLVQIHCFPNGNGRHALTWKYATMVSHDEIRREYISAIKEADKGNIKPLLEFARSKNKG